MPDFFSVSGPPELTLQSICIRVFLALLLGGVLGIERTRKRRAAGFRTHILVCISASLVMMTGQYISVYIGASDPARLGAQVISGIGFLGAGTILVTGARGIKGLTTAASLWAAACMGLAVGIGFYIGAILAFVSIFIVITLFDPIQARFVSRSKFLQLYIIFENITNLSDFINLCKEKNIHVDHFDTMRSPTGSGIAVLFMLCFKERHTHAEKMEVICSCPGILSVEET